MPAGRRWELGPAVDEVEERGGGAPGTTLGDDELRGGKPR
jgi:hypothetical protein